MFRCTLFRGRNGVTRIHVGSSRRFFTAVEIPVYTSTAPFLRLYAHYHARTMAFHLLRRMSLQPILCRPLCSARHALRRTNYYALQRIVTPRRCFTAISSTPATSSSSSTTITSLNSSAPSSSASVTPTEIKLTAHYIGQFSADPQTLHPLTYKFTRPDCILVPLTPTPSPIPLTQLNPNEAYAFVFPYGAVVFIQATDAQQQSLISKLNVKPINTAIAPAIVPTQISAATSAASASSGTLIVKDDYKIILNAKPNFALFFQH